jgi:hypothetical protein
MPTAPLSAELRTAAPGVAARLRAILLGMAALIAHGFLRNPARVALILPLWNRLRRTAGRFDRLMARVAQGKHQPRPSGPRRERSEATPPTRPVLVLPAKHGWKLDDRKHEAALYTQRLEVLLSEPETAALIAHAPRLVSLLRPLCHMLGVRHAAIPPRPRRRRPLPPLVPARRPANPAPHRGAGSTATRLHPLIAAPSPRPSHASDTCPHLERWPWVPHPSMRHA